jgi:hypothetical protein
VVFAGHDPVESASQAEHCLVAKLADDATGVEFVVGVEAE